MLDADLLTIAGEFNNDEVDRLHLTWYFIFRHYLRTPRDVRRFVNALAVSLPLLRDVTDPVDLILLELMRIFEPEVYDWIRENIQNVAE